MNVRGRYRDAEMIFKVVTSSWYTCREMSLSMLYILIKFRLNYDLFMVELIGINRDSLG